MKKIFAVVAVLVGVYGAYAQQGVKTQDLPEESLYIIFAADSASLSKLNTEVSTHNAQVFISLANTLAAHPEYRLLIDGHANPVLFTQKEEKTQLKPLSVQRAEAVAEFLISYYGVKRESLVVIGSGGNSPIAPSGNRTDEYINRRVDFEIIKPKTQFSGL